MPPSLPPDPQKGTSFLDLSPPRSSSSGTGFLKPPTPTPHAAADRSYSLPVLPLPRPPSREGKSTRNKLRKKTSRLFGLSSPAGSLGSSNVSDSKDDDDDHHDTGDGKGNQEGKGNRKGKASPPAAAAAAAAAAGLGMSRNHSAPQHVGMPMLDTHTKGGPRQAQGPRRSSGSPYLAGLPATTTTTTITSPARIRSRDDGAHFIGIQSDVQSLASSSTSGSGPGSGPGSGTSMNVLPPQQQQQQAIGTRMSTWFNHTFLSPPTNPPQTQSQSQAQARPIKARGEPSSHPAHPLRTGAERAASPPHSRPGPGPGPGLGSGRAVRRNSSRSGTSSITGRKEDQDQDNDNQRDKSVAGSGAGQGAGGGGGAGGWSSRRQQGPAAAAGEWRKSHISSSDAASVSSAGTNGTTTGQAFVPPPSLSSFPRAPSNSSSNTTTAATAAAHPLINSMTSLLTSARAKALISYRSLVDSEAYPDGCEEAIWVRGVRFGYGGLGSGGASASASASGDDGGGGGGEAGKGKVNANASASANANAGKPKIGGRRGKKGSDGSGGVGGAEGYTWPAGFLLDFRSTVWCTYRSQYAPILALKQGEEIVPTPRTYMNGRLPPLQVEKRGERDEGGRSVACSSGTSAAVVDPAGKAVAQGQAQAQGKTSAWATWMSNISSVNINITGGSSGGGGNGEGTTNERGLTADSGWGCMLRTGQSLLANALLSHQTAANRVLPGVDWRLPDTLLADGPPLDSQAMKDKYATYIQILSWFLDDPSPVCPFSVHRMALVGKQLGKEVGEWFGPSTAAGAIKTLANGFPLCGLSIVTAVDSTIYASDVIEASHQPLGEWQELVRTMPVRARGGASGAHGAVGGWGDQGVLILAGVRLGMEGVNPLYHDSIKALFTFPQSVGIAGGRPGSSYYFIGCQADNLFYLDPHFTRPAIPLKTRTEKRDPSDPTRVIDSAHDNDPRNDGASAEVDWLLGVYTSDQLKTFHCDKVKKMPISSLDPSMLIGFLCKDNDDWLDLRERLNNLPHRIISIENMVPTWNDDSDDPDIESFTDTDMEEDSLDVPSSPSTVALDLPPSRPNDIERPLAELSTGVEYEDGDQVILAAPGTAKSASLINERADTASPYLVVCEPSPPPTPTLSASQRGYTRPVNTPDSQPTQCDSSPAAPEALDSESVMEESFDSVDVPLPMTHPTSNSRHRSNSSGSHTLSGNHRTGTALP
ncbi:hypothetical protein QFC24_002284 [Naganishia onofrii]|uniref:Uncharacterized protein n=1 Tax=Naganishia onofrii TaxID=1851511 RepID=A0ACC2XRZ3_9TREE|nr:hypothetical protein QFC24_002284 [Naganishia onofrii]